FQAEDGIRDDLVTGVQTCALPISDEEVAALIEEGAERARRRGAPAAAAELLDHAVRVSADDDRRVQRTLRAAIWKGEAGDAEGRSEERRVGKGWRWWGGR